jgi:hypothetical protein
MNYLAPVINHVHNNLNSSLSIRLSNGRFALPAKQTTVLDFDVMSLANGSEQRDLYNAVAEGYLDVDIYVLTKGEYVKVGKYEATKQEPKKAQEPSVATTVTSEERAKTLGIKTEKIEHKKESINVVETKQVEQPKEEPIKEEPKKETALKSVKNNAKKAE